MENRARASKKADRPFEFSLWLLQTRRSARTIYRYGRSIDRFERWLRRRRKSVQSAKWEDIRDFAETLPYTYGSRSALQSALKAYWRYLEREDCLAWAVPCPKKPRMLPRPLSRDELSRVMSAARGLGAVTFGLVCCMYFLGLRREEAATLRWAQFREDGRLHIVGKGGIEAFLPVHADVLQALDPLRRDSAFVFPGAWGDHIHPGSVNRHIAIVSDISGIPFTPHRLRHTAITNGYRGTKDVFATQEFARHADPRTTKGYTQVEWGQVEAVSDALTVDQPRKLRVLPAAELDSEEPDAS